MAHGGIAQSIFGILPAPLLLPSAEAAERTLRIPINPATQSDPNRPPNPEHSGHPRRG